MHVFLSYASSFKWDFCGEECAGKGLDFLRIVIDGMCLFRNANEKNDISSLLPIHFLRMLLGNALINKIL